nr:MYB1 [Ipomoea trifida]
MPKPPRRQQENGRGNIVDIGPPPRPPNFSKLSSFLSLGTETTTTTPTTMPDNDVSKRTFTPSPPADSVTQWWENLLAIGERDGAITWSPSLTTSDEGDKAVGDGETWSRVIGDGKSTFIEEGEFSWNEFQFPMGTSKWNDGIWDLGE